MSMSEEAFAGYIDMSTEYLEYVQRKSLKQAESDEKKHNECLALTSK